VPLPAGELRTTADAGSTQLSSAAWRAALPVLTSDGWGGEGGSVGEVMSMEDPERDLMMLAFYDPVRWDLSLRRPITGTCQHNLRTNLTELQQLMQSCRQST
jgi:hypothetical protein